MATFEKHTDVYLNIHFKKHTSVYLSTHFSGGCCYKQYTNIDDFHWKRILDASNAFADASIGPKVIAIGEKDHVIVYRLITPFNELDRNVRPRQFVIERNENGSITNHYFRDLTDEEIVAKITEIIEKMHKLGYDHGNLCLENIGFDASANIYILEHDFAYKTSDGIPSWLENYVERNHATWSNSWLEPLPIKYPILVVLRQQFLSPEEKEIIPKKYIDAMKEVNLENSGNWIYRALCVCYLIETDYKDLNSPLIVYGSDGGIHIGWGNITIHVFVRADDDVDPQCVYSLQVFDPTPPYNWSPINFKNPHDLLRAARLEAMKINPRSLGNLSLAHTKNEIL